jgi:hypothetical protein
MNPVECVGWAGVLFALAHILAAVGGLKVKPAVHLLMSLAGGFVLCAIATVLWPTAMIPGG